MALVLELSVVRVRASCNNYLRMKNEKRKKMEKKRSKSNRTPFSLTQFNFDHSIARHSTA